MPQKISIPVRKASLKRKPLKIAAKGTVPTRKTGPEAKDPELTAQPTQLKAAERKFELAAVPETKHKEPPAYEYLGELPESYGTKKLYMVARDPHWLFAYWDLSWQQYQEAARSAHDGKVFLELYLTDGARIQQIQIHESTKNWYLQVNKADTHFFAQLGYYDFNHQFQVISRSPEAYTPRDTISWRTQAKFVTVPFGMPFRTLLDSVTGTLSPDEELVEALARIQEAGEPLPFPVEQGMVLTDDQHQALLDYLGAEYVTRRQVGSLEITEVLRRRFHEMTSSGQWTSSPGMGGLQAFGLGGSSLSSPFGASFGAMGSSKGRAFHMHVNAELIIYGGTEPDANVRIDGQTIKLREDGTFSYHFVFPDGRYHIPVEATAADGEETRSALLSFLRLSEYAGDVRKTGQPPLQPPLGEF